MNKHNRRHFLRSALQAGVALPVLGNQLLAKRQADGFMFTKVGVNAPLKLAQAVKNAGGDYLLIGVNKFLVPSEPEAAFEKQLQLLKSSPIPVLSCNGFLRGPHLRSVGPDAKHDNVLKFADTAFKRAKRAGVKYIIFGSGGSRKRPDNWSTAQADAQFVSLLKKMAPLAEAQEVTVAVENLRAQECNYLSRLREVGEIVKKVDHPYVRILADFYHASFMDEPPEDFAKYAPLTAMVEIAEKKGRTPPGVNGQDFRPYFNALKDGGYRGPIEIEGRWKIAQLPKAFATIREQAS